MDDLPTLVKPYFTLDEAFARLKQAGAQLDKVEDILLLARNGLLEVGLLCERSITLVSTACARPLTFPLEEMRPLLLDYLAELVEEGFYSQSEIDARVASLGDSEAVLYVKGSFLDVNESDLPYLELNRVALDQTSLVVTPMNVFLPFYSNAECEFFGNCDGQDDLEPYIRPADWMNKNPYPILKNQLSVVGYNGQTYYVCGEYLGNFFNEEKYTASPVKIKTPCIEEAYKSGEIRFFLDSCLLQELVNEMSHVVTKETIKLFEQLHLGVNHELDAIEKLPYLDAKNENYAQELDIAIEAHTAIFSNNEGNQNQSRTERVKTWLKNKYPNKSEAFYERITTVVLPKKNK